MGMLMGLAMGLLVIPMDILTGEHHAIVPITLGLMLVESIMGFYMPGWLAEKCGDLASYIVAFFIVP